MASLDGLRQELKQRTVITARLAAHEGEQVLKRRSPIKSGEMRNRSTVRSRTDPRGAMIELEVDTDYAEYVRSGTRPHRITARNAEALRFDWRGDTVFFRSVNHPGTQPNRWFDDTVRDMGRIISRAWGQVNL